MENLETHERIINLGKALVDELELDPGTDTLSRWMAHYIAQQIELARNATESDKIEVEQRCFDAILKLWKNRSTFLNNRRPFQNFEAIFNVLKKLDPDLEQPFYFQLSGEEYTTTEYVQNWLDKAIKVDKAARVILEYIFGQAALCASDNRSIELLFNSPKSKDIEDTSVILELLGNFYDDPSSNEEIKNENRNAILSKIETMRTINKLSHNLLTLYEKELGESQE